MGSLQAEALENKSFFPANPLDPEEFRKHGHMVVDFIADYYRNVAEYPVLSQVQPGYLRERVPESAPNQPESIDQILADIQSHIVPGLTHWQSPYYFAYFPSSGSTAGFLGEMLSVGFNVVGFNWMSSPAATELESIVMDWLGKMLCLPEPFLFSGGGGGVLQGTTCEAMLCTLTAAREKMLNKFGRDQIGKLSVYCSDQTHCALKKAAQIAGIYPENIRAIQTYKANAFGLAPESFKQTVEADIAAGLIPLYLCATVGTTSSTAVDPIDGLCEVANEHNIWVHVDAAYGGSACICPEFRHYIDGVDKANSFSFNAHKWFFATLDCCCLWVKEPGALVQALSTNPEYLKNKATDSKKVVDYKDWQIQLSRRFRALKLWMVLKSYGVANLRSFIRSHVAMAKMFENLVRMDPKFEIVVPTTFAMVCFRLNYKYEFGDNYELGFSEEVMNEMNKRLLDAVNATGKVYVTHAVVGGVYFIRFAVGASLTEEHHVEAAWKVVQQQAEVVLEELHPEHAYST